MIIDPIIPIWLMLLVCIGLVALRIKDTKGLIIQICICLLLFSINLRPMLTKGTVYTEESNLDVVFVVDNTISMLARDYNGNNTRFQGMAEDCKDITEKLAGARFSVISFNNYARIVVPFTTDANMVINSVETLNALDEYDAKGSSLNTPKEALNELLNRSREGKETRKTIVFFMSDGEITNNDKLTSYKEVGANVDGGAVIGYGTNQGGEMSYIDKYSGEPRTVYDYNSGRYAISMIDENNLKALAKDMDVEYIHSNGKNGLADKAAEISEQAEYKGTGTKEGGRTDIYIVFLIPLMLLFAVEWFIFERRKVVL